MLSLLALSAALPLLSLVNAQFYAGCDVSGFTLDLPDNQTQLVLPSTKPNSIALGVGVQNYTCGPAGTFVSAGAVAQFYDISCLAATQSPTFVIVQDIVFSLWNGSDQFNQQDLVVLDKLTTATWEQPIVLGTHFFQENSTGNGISPVFDYRAASRQQDPQGFVLAAGQGTLPAPTDPTTDVNWLQLKGVSGNLGSTVFRVDTIGGQPLASCKTGDPPLSVKYAAKYWFFGGPASPLLTSKSSTSTHSSASSTSTSGSKDADALGSSSNLGSSSTSSDSNFPIMIALVAINGLFVVGALAAIVVYLMKRKSGASNKYVTPGPQFAPKGAMEEVERELGPYDPVDPYAGKR